MESNKFEETIRQKLEKRTITPSKNSWKTLEKQLAKQETKKEYTNAWWLTIAAGFIGILFVSTVYFNNKRDFNTTEIVDVPHQIEEKIEPSEKEFIKNEVEKGIIVENKTLSQESKKLVKKPSVRPTKGKVVSKVKNDNQAIVITKKPKQKNLETTFETQKVEEVVAQILELKAHNAQVTNTEIDSLLAIAQHEITRRTNYENNKGMVDANSLLQDVEEDIEQSFRMRVFESLKSSYKSVKTAVVTRNE